jgi:hypothetical protein
MEAMSVEFFAARFIKALPGKLPQVFVQEKLWYYQG